MSQSGQNKAKVALKQHGRLKLLQIVPQPSRHPSHHVAAVDLRGVRRRNLPRHQLPGGYRFAGAVGGAEEDAGGGAEGRAGGGVGQMWRSLGFSEADGAVEDAHGEFAHAVQLAGAAGQDQAGAGLQADAGVFQTITEQFEGFLDARGDHGLQHGAGHDDRAGGGFLAARGCLQHFAVLIGAGHGRAVQGL